jgi:hypothetical protein
MHTEKVNCYHGRIQRGFRRAGMSDHHQELSRQTVERFRDSLDDAAREHISAAQFEDLQQMIQHLLSQERSHIADLMAAFARTLRSGVEKPEIDL